MRIKVFKALDLVVLNFLKVDKSNDEEKCIPVSCPHVMGEVESCIMTLLRIIF